MQLSRLRVIPPLSKASGGGGSSGVGGGVEVGGGGCFSQPRSPTQRGIGSLQELQFHISRDTEPLDGNLGRTCSAKLNPRRDSG